MKQQHSSLRNMSEGSPAGHIFFFALPLFLGSLLQQMYNMVDSFVVGNYVGDSALAAVGIGFPVIFLFTSLFTGMANGGTVVIAQLYGAGKLERVRDAVDTLYTTFFYAVIPLTLLAVALVKPLLFLLRVEDSAYDDAFTYLFIVCAGLIGTIGFNTNSSILQGLGNSRAPLLFLAVSTVLNVVLDLIFVLQFGMGVAGVALATIISQAASWLFGIFHIRRFYPQVNLRPFSRRFDKALFKQIMHIGLPAGLQMGLVSIGILAITSKVNSYGQSFAAGFNVGTKLDQMAFLPIQGLCASITTFVGQNVGAGQPQRVRQGVRQALVMGFAWSVVAGIGLTAASPYLVRMFSPSVLVVEAGVLYIRSIMPLFCFFAVSFLLNAAMRGAGESIFPMASTVFSLILVRVPLCYWLADTFGRDSMFYSVSVGWAVGCTLSAMYYLSGRWKRHGNLANTL